MRGFLTFSPSTWLPQKHGRLLVRYDKVQAPPHYCWGLWSLLDWYEEKTHTELVQGFLSLHVIIMGTILVWSQRRGLRICASQVRGSSTNLFPKDLWLIHPNLTSLDQFGVFASIVEIICARNINLWTIKRSVCFVFQFTRVAWILSYRRNHERLVLVDNTF